MTSASVKRSPMLSAIEGLSRPIQTGTGAGLAATAMRERRVGNTARRHRREAPPRPDLVAKGLTVRDTAVRLKVGKTAFYVALGRL